MCVSKRLLSFFALQKSSEECDIKFEISRHGMGDQRKKNMILKIKKKKVYSIGIGIDTDEYKMVCTIHQSMAIC